MKKIYIPNPIDTTDVVLPEELASLSERLAENTHENWSAGRIKADWKYGPRDDGKRTHPDLVPYAELSEEEKGYDRITSQETIKVILKLGYTINPPKNNLT